MKTSKKTKKARIKNSIDEGVKKEGRRNAENDVFILASGLTIIETFRTLITMQGKGSKQEREWARTVLDMSADRVVKDLKKRATQGQKYGVLPKS